MEMIPLKSSNLAAAGFDPETRVLDILFVNGTTYSYDEVPQSIADGLFQAPSAGQYFAMNIKNRYRYYKG